MPVVEDSDQVLPLLKVGDEVTTDEGPGVLVGVQFQTAQYNGKWELEPPQLEVDLDSGKTIYTCLCSIELPNTQKGTKLIHQEFDRLWPPRTEAVPEDADMLIPEGDEEPIREGLKEAKMNDYLKKELARYLEYVDAADRDELIKAFKRFFGLPLLKPISREEYERLGRELGIEVFPDDELGSYADKYGSYDFWTYGWLNDRLEMPLRQSRWFGLMREQPEPAQEPKRPTLEPQGQLWEQCEQCGEEPSYMPLHLCQRCWPNERTATMQYRANALLDIDDEQMVRAANELFREEDLDPEDFQAETHYLSGIWIQPIGQAWGPEFVLVESYDEAIKMAEEKVREDLENEPELFNKDWLIHYIREDKLRGALDEINSIYDDLAYEIDLRPEDAAEQMDVDPDDFIDQDGYIDETALRVHLTDMLDDYAEREARARRDEYIKKAINWGGIDYFKAAENAVNTDGPGHFLAHYDGEIRELPSGAVYFRTN